VHSKFKQFLPISPVAVFSDSVKISFEYHMLLGLSRVLLHKNRYSRLLIKKNLMFNFEEDSARKDKPSRTAYKVALNLMSDDGLG